MIRRNLKRTLAAVAALAALQGAVAADDRAPQIPDLKVETYTLPNGLQVILHEDHTTPVVGVNLWYRVGSKNEKEGRTGFAHLFEHLMFEGSEHHKAKYDRELEQFGAQLNGTTSEDRTSYYETVPGNVLELALWLEADRMGFLLPALSQEKLDVQRGVVKNERRQRVDNQPYGLAEEKQLEALYPAGHPYHHSVIGSMADLSAASLGDVSAFFRTYYGPNNASLCLAGDFDPAQAKAWVAKYFGPLPKGPEVKQPRPSVPALSEPKHVTMTDQVSLPRVQLIWPTVPVGHPDEQALDLLAAILGGLDKDNRLYRALQYDRQLAAHVSASHPTHALSGTFDVEVYARPGLKLDEVVKLADAEIARLKADGPTAAEVLKAQNERESQFVVGSLQSMTRRADTLNLYNVMLGSPLAYKEELRKVFAVTPADVKRVANQYLTADRLRLDVVPGPPSAGAGEAEVDRSKQAPMENPSVAAVRDDFDRARVPEIGPTPKFTPPAVVRRKLSNGLEVLVAERHNLPLLTLDLVVKGGETLVPKGKEGLASMTGTLLTEGTTTLDGPALAGALAEIGASLDAKGALESTTLSLTTLTKHTDRALALYTDVLLHPSFPERALNRHKLQHLAMLRARLDEPEGVAGVVFPRLLYGLEHPYGRPDLGTPRTVVGLTRDDVVAFHKRLFLPNNAALIVVGDTTPDAITDVLESALKGWKSGEAPASAFPEPPPAKKVTVYLVDKPGAAQSYLAVGHVGQPRGTPDYFPLTVLNAVLGGQFNSRLNLNLREEKAYSYGVYSHFHFRLGPGPFEVAGAVETAVTREALVELVKEVTDITGARPVTDAELAFAKERIIRGFPARFETTAGVAGTLMGLVLYKLPADYFATYQAKVEAVTKADMERVAKKYLDPDHLTVLVVGDRAKVETPLRSLPFARVINALEPEGNPLPAATDSAPAEGNQ